MSGVRTVEDLRDRCRIDEFTDCWHWAGAVSCGVPRVWAASIARTITGARAAWLVSTGDVPPAGSTVYHWKGCGSTCVNPRHLRLGTKAEAGAALRAHGKLRGSQARAISNLRNGMKSSKATPELRALILASDEPGTHLAPKVGLSHSTISMIRRGKRWAGLAGSSVFSAWGRAA